MFSRLKDKEPLLIGKETLSELFKDDAFKTALCGRLISFLPSKRWYSAKDDTISGVSVCAAVPLSDAAGTVFTVIRVSLKGGEEPMFFMPLRLAFGEAALKIIEKSEGAVVSAAVFGEKSGVIYDAAGDADFSASVLPMLYAAGCFDAGDGMVLCGSATQTGRRLIDEVRGLPQKMLGVEQSNTSLIIGKKVMLKMYRRVAFGSHPEVATTSFLTQTAKFENTPAYLGMLELKFPDGRSMALGILQSFVPNEGDGWSYTMEYLKKYFSDIIAQKTVSEKHDGYMEKARLLGRRTAEMHKAFAKGTDAVFAPVPVTRQDLDDWRAQVLAQVDKTLAVASQNVGHLSGEMRRRTENLIKRREQLAARINELVPEKTGGFKTRFHGDYHLGQVVIDAAGDFYILDFEGEPLRPITERQIRHCILKDVAGMVRSFDYAAFGAVLMYVVPEERAVVAPFAAEWQKQATEAFLDGYFEHMAGCASLPGDKETTRKLLDLFILEKALYEVIYEVANRPDWLAIPMNGLARLTDLDGE